MLSSIANRARYKPWEYFIKKHFNVVHKNESYSKRGKIASEWSSGDVDNGIVFDVGEFNVCDNVG